MSHKDKDDWHYFIYDPKQDRYISQDPIGLKGGINNYVYALNPNQLVDPLGLVLPLVLWGGVALAAATTVATVTVQGPIVVDGDFGNLKGYDSLSPAQLMALLFAHTMTRGKTCTDTETETKKCPPCDPPIGTPCVGSMHPHDHKGINPHHHEYQMNQKPAPDCECVWNKKRAAKFTHLTPPSSLISCSAYGFYD